MATNNLRDRLTLEERQELARHPNIRALNRALYSFEPRITFYIYTSGNPEQMMIRQGLTGSRIRSLLEHLPVTGSETIELTNSSSRFRHVIIKYVRNEGDADIAIARALNVTLKIANLLQSFPGTIGDPAAETVGTFAGMSASLTNKCIAPKVWDPITETCV
jgi:hypothetical protein